MSNMPMPSYNAGEPEYAGTAAPVPPKQIGWAFQLLIAAAVLQVLATIFGVIYISSEKFRAMAAETLAKQNLPSTGADLVDVSVTVALSVAIVSAVLAVIVYVLIALFIRRGMGWARITGAVLAVISFYQLANLMMPGGLFTIVQVLAGVAAIVLCFIAPGAQYFTEMKNYRLANKRR
ncbi:hypothetical protein [Specibacter sp. RAF43]|uniref:hypothetical protein n=1 Tax=Specibacter sp. RAF43 TaxID=3233057 RepID=UPI003F9466D6